MDFKGKKGKKTFTTKYSRKGHHRLLTWYGERHRGNNDGEKNVKDLGKKDNSNKKRKCKFNTKSLIKCT